MRVVALLVLSALLLAGCMGDPQHVTPPGREDPHVVAERFDRVDAPWVAQVAGGCGFCEGDRSFRLDGEHFSLFVFDDARVLLAEWNGWTQPPGEMHVDANVTFDRAQLRELLADSPRARDGEVWVVRLTTARLADPTIVDDLRASWATGSEDMQCTDSGVSYLFRHANGTVAEESFTCGPQEGEPLVRYAAKLNELVEAMRSHGDVQGRPGVS